MSARRRPARFFIGLMPEISPSELRAVDNRIDAGIADFGIWKLPRPVVLLHLLRYYEDYLRLGLPGLIGTDDVDSYLAGRKNAQDAMQFALAWAAERTPPSDDVDLELRSDAYELCLPMFEGAIAYSHVWDVMVLLFQERARGEWDGPDRIKVSYKDPLASEFDVAGRLVAPPDPPGFRDRIGPEPAAFRKLVGKMKPRDVGGGKVGYELLPDIFDAMKAVHRDLLSHLWELDGSWDVGGYTLVQFREVWLSLVTLCFAHQLACWNSGAMGGGIRSLVQVKGTSRWEKDLARRSGIAETAVSRIIADLTFTPELHRPGKKQPDVTYQPFVPLGQGLLALAGSLVLDSNAERNLWDLLSIIRPKVHSDLRNRKERYWADELRPWLESLGLESATGLAISFAGKNSDLDLLIIDRARSFGLGCQMKWLTAPDRIRDVGYTDKELIVGTRQAELSLKWLESKPEVIRQKFGLTADELAAIRFQAAVLSKNFLGSSVVYRQAPDIPVITERILKWILGGDPHDAPLEALWRTGKSRSYFPIAGVHYEDLDFEASFAGIAFFGAALGMNTLKAWNPASDIKIETK